MLDSALAELYGVPVKRLNEQVKRNTERFPADFSFQVTKEEYEQVRTELSDDDLAQVAGGCVCGCYGRYHCPSML